MLRLQDLRPVPPTQDHAQLYLERLTQQMFLKLAPDWKPEAKEIARMLTDSGLLLTSPPLQNAIQFLMDAIRENPMVWENSLLHDLRRQQYRPQLATSAFEIASMLVPYESD
jgi:hypothetical protein